MRHYEIDRSKIMVTEHRDLAFFMRSRQFANGYHIIANDETPLVILNNYRGFDTTVVFFHAAIEDHYTLPVLTGLGVSANAPVNRIFISDPSLLLDDSLNLAWFAGSASQRLQPILEDVISHLFHSHQAAKRLAFFGASGGGFAALFYSSKFDGSLAIVANPQTSIERYDPASVLKFARICFQSDWPAGEKSALPHSVATDLTRIYARRVGNTIAYLQNRDDSKHVEHHLEPFLEAFHSENKIMLLIGDWGMGHVAPPKELCPAGAESHRGS